MAFSPATITRKLKTYGELVMFRHTLFALPFALVGLYLGAEGWPSVRTFFWALISLAGARNAANAVNRLLDHAIDAKNPRTSHRHLPQGLVSRWEVLGLSIVGFGLLFLGAWMINPLCLYLSPFAVIVLVGYSYTKRFTWACHYILGFAVGLAPTASWLAVTGSFSLPPIILTLTVMLWVAGFDIIYATLDYDFDRQKGIFAIPARFGIKRALTISAVSHTLSVALLFFLPYSFTMTGQEVSFNLFYFAGVMGAGGLMLTEHIIINPNDLKRVKIASYNINEIVGFVVLLGVLLGTSF